MAFTRENLTVIANSLKNGVVPSKYSYYNEANDTLTAIGFFNDARLIEGDVIEALSSDYSTLKFYVVSAVSALKATVVLADIGIDGISVDDLSVGTLDVSGAATFASDVSVGGAISSIVNNASLLLDSTGAGTPQLILKSARDNSSSWRSGTIYMDGRSNGSGTADAEGAKIQIETLAGTSAGKIKGRYIFYVNNDTTGDAVLAALTLGNDGAAAFANTVTVGAYTLPATDGTNGQVLMTNGSGVLTWTTP